MSDRFIFLHGWSLGPAQWTPLAERLGAAVEVHHAVLPGHAGRPGQPGWTVDGLAASLLERHPTATWIGASLGGLVALAAASLAPEAVSGLVLVGATPCFVARDGWPHAMPRKAFEGFHAASLAHPERNPERNPQRNPERNPERNPQRNLERFDALQLQGDAAGRAGLRHLRRLRASEPRATPEALAEGLRVLAATDLRARLPGISCPTLWIAGEQDALVPAAAARAAAGIQPRARVCYVPGAGHAPYLTHTGVVADAVLGWLREERLSQSRESLA